MPSMSTRELGRDVSAAKRAAREGLVSRLSMDDDSEFEPTPLQGELRSADL